MVPTPKQMLIALMFVLQHRVCPTTSVHIRMCKTECRKVQGLQASEAGFVFMRCKVLADTTPSDVTQNMTTFKCLLGRELYSGDSFTNTRDKTTACHKEKDLTEQKAQAGISSLLILPQTSGRILGYRLNLATNEIQSFHVPWGLTFSVVYMRGESRFLIAKSNKIITSGLHKAAKTVTVKKIPNIEFMRYDEDRSLVFLVGIEDDQTKVSRMRRNGQKFRLLLKIVRGSGYQIAINSKIKQLYLAQESSIIQFNYDGKERKTVVKDKFTIYSFTFDPVQEILYYVYRKLLMQLSVNGQRSAVIDMKERGIHYNVHSMEFHLNVLYMISFTTTDRIISVDVCGNPVLNEYKLPRPEKVQSNLCLM